MAERTRDPEKKESTRRPFINRELSWLEFNARVLAEGSNEENPLLERLSFLAIVAGNLDEFFMVRVGGLQQLRRAGKNPHCPSGLSTAEQLRRISARAHTMMADQYRVFNREILPTLAQQGIACLRHETMALADLARVDRYFMDELFPMLTPVAVASRQCPTPVEGLCLHLAVRLRKQGRRNGPADSCLAFIAIPRSISRFFQLPREHGHRFVLIEEIVRHHVRAFFAGFEVCETAVFRITRNADLELTSDENDDLVESMEDILRARRDGAPVRLEIESGASRELVAELVAAVGITEARDVYRIDGPVDLKAFLRLAGQVDAKNLRFRAFDPSPVAELETAPSLWEAIRERDVLVHLPYQSFRPVIDLLDAAAVDPQVLAIKQTLYRTSADSPIIASLEKAAHAGKRVTVLVELKARFDEAQNISWARRLSEAGAQVIYGVVGLKTHAKLLLIVRREPGGTRRYVHVSTGNYNDLTATRYEDVSIFTADPDFGIDASNFFNAVTGYSEPRDWRQFVVAPTNLRERLTELIDREIARATPEVPGRITLKMNSLTDRNIIMHLLRAAQSHVRVRLCVRGACCLRPRPLPENSGVEVRGLVDRFLEHSRVFHFHNGGDEEIYLSSADLMPRNLDRRLEVMVPVRDAKNKSYLIHVLDTVFADNQRAWRLLPDGRYERVTAGTRERPCRAQERLLAEAAAGSGEIRKQRLTVFRPVVGPPPANA
jgi:polyphosphate kinase